MLIYYERVILFFLFEFSSVGLAWLCVSFFGLRLVVAAAAAAACVVVPGVSVPSVVQIIFSTKAHISMRSCSSALHRSGLHCQ
jgi:hypothetical protein